MPKELVAIASRQPVLRDYEDGPLPADSVRVQVEFGAPKRGTEMTMYYGLRGAGFPQGLGNMCVGKVSEIGSEVEGVEIGERVAGYGHLKETHTWNAQRILKMNERMTWKEAVCYDPAHFALAAVRDGQVRVGDRVAVFGLGALGLMSQQFAKIAGADFVAVVDPIEGRRAVAEKTGADLVLDPTACNVGEALKEATGGLGVDVAIETSANYHALDDAIRSVAFEGTVVVVGWAKECKGGLDLGAVAHFNIPNLIFARANSDPNRDHPRWSFGRIIDTCWKWLSEGRFDCEDIVAPVVSFADAAATYEEMDNYPERSVKLGVSFS
ncbi:alcohol dehydrogenase [Candidatus Poribacteria bacterium]|nr:MAG: alcohol dehydrogenase [Candidatus Poribacteria bacterium]